jgi:hypothetical protein
LKSEGSWKTSISMGGGNSPLGTSDFINVRSSNTGWSIGKFMHGSMVAKITLTIMVGENPK